MEYQWNETAKRMAEHLIEKYHTRLDRVKVAYLFKIKPVSDKPAKPSKPLRDGKKITWAKAARVSPKWQALMDEDYQFVIEFDMQIWDRLTLEQQEALVDHELCHCGVDADGYYMRSHDLEEFREIVRRHGFWKDDVKQFAEVTMPLFEKAGA